MPITRVEDAQESGFAQVREALQSFEGDVISAEFGMWGTGGLGDDGKPLPQNEYFDIVNANVKVLTVSEELSMPISEWTIRIKNCSSSKGSFWVEGFLKAADRAKVLIPEELIGKRVLWKKVTVKAKDPKFNATNFIIDKVIGAQASGPQVVASVPPGVTVEAVPSVTDPMEVACDLANGKTETQFRSAASLKEEFINSPLLPLIKAGAVTKSLVEQGKLVEVTEGNKTIYKKPE